MLHGFQRTNALDLSASSGCKLSDDVQITRKGRNLTNMHAFTSGNFREGFTRSNSPYGDASPIPGRVLRLIADFNL